MWSHNGSPASPEKPNARWINGNWVSMPPLRPPHDLLCDICGKRYGDHYGLYCSKEEDNALLNDVSTSHIAAIIKNMQQLIFEDIILEE